MIAPTPKFRSGEFKSVLASLKEIFDAHSLGVVVLDAMERRAAEQIYGKFNRGMRSARLANVKRSHLAGHVTAGFFNSDEIAFQIIKELDRACQKERHIVASIPEAQAPDRIGSYRAIALKRERAKFVWALARDSRESVRALANRIITEFFAEAADMEKTRAVLDGEEREGTLDQVGLAKRLKDQAELLSEASNRVTDLESKVDKHEEDRAKLLAQIGAKERRLKQEHEAREELEGQLFELKQALATVESEQAALEAAKKSEHEAQSKAEDLAQKVRRLTKMAGAQERLSQVQTELDETKKKLEEAERTLSRQAEAHHEQKDGFLKEEARLKAELDEKREELRRTRKALTELERKRSAAPDGEEPSEGVAILLDQANLAATAALEFGRKVNFASLLERLATGRKIVRALAFVVDNGGTAFDAFCDTLRRAGWDLRVKKPKTFKDGSTKADWDMGMAMEAVELRGQVKTLVLGSGDGDFAPLVRLLKRWGIRVEVAAYSEALALDLVDAADAVTRLDAGTLE